MKSNPHNKTEFNGSIAPRDLKDMMRAEDSNMKKAIDTIDQKLCEAFSTPQGTMEGWEKDFKKVFYSEFNEVGYAAVDTTYETVLDFVHSRLSLQAEEIAGMVREELIYHHKDIIVEKVINRLASKIESLHKPK